MMEGTHAMEGRRMTPLDPASPQFLDELISLRRRLHATPEIGLHLPATQRIVLDALAGLDLEITLGTATSSVVAVLRGGRPGPVVLLRGDMDGLPLLEETGLPFASTNGAMHACGHDLHVAGLVGAARLLAAERESLPGAVVLMFQPGEEGDDGVHVAADSRSGLVSTRPGTLMAAYSVLDVRVIGRGGHGSRPHQALDPVPATAEMVSALYTRITRRYSPFDPVVLTVGELHAGSAPNIIPGQAHFRAGVRSFRPATAEALVEDLPAFVTAIGRAHGLAVEATMRTVLPATVNDGVEAAFFARTARELFGEEEFLELEDPRTGSEDFSSVLAEIPGAYGFVGATPDYDPAHPPASNHSAQGVFDYSVLVRPAQLLATLARRRLEEAVGEGDPGI
jgi:hippurate hydrolase